MREKRIAASEPKRRLLAAAERLFAERGFEAVSVRDITQASKANVAAVNYHFGSREELIELTINRHLAPIQDERLARMEALARKASGNSAPPLEELIEAYVRPLAATVRKSELPEALFLKLLGRILALQGDEFPEDMAQRIKSLRQRFMKMLAKCLPELTAEEIQWRLHFIDGALIHLLLRPELAGVPAASPLDAAFGRLIRFAAAGLRDGTDDSAALPKGPQAMFDF